MRSIATVMAAAALLVTGSARAFDVEFTYQGYLENNTTAVAGPSTVPIVFRLHTDPEADTAIGGDVTKAPGEIFFYQGLFSVGLSFDVGAFDGTQLWLEVVVDGTALSPRQKVTAAPYSLATRGITVDDDGRVGIGVDDPLNPLHVDGSIRAASFRAMGGGNTVNLFNPNNEGASFFLGWLNDVPRLRIGGNGAGANGGFDIQRIGDQSLFRVDGGNGYVGIHEGNPDLRLTLDQQGLGIHDPASHTLGFHTNGAERMRITSEGKVGIGTTNPGDGLDIVYADSGSRALDVFNDNGGAARFRGRNNSTVEVFSIGGTSLNINNLGGSGSGGIVVNVPAGVPLSVTNGGNHDLAVFENSNVGNNRIRFDWRGRGYFNGGTQTGGADVAEWFEVEGTPADYEPGDLLAISTETDRTVTLSAEPYCTLVAGVHATNPGVLLTERHVDADHSDMVPMGVVGVLPTKVTAENGKIRRGDLLVSSSLPGHAMLGTDRDRMLGAIIGKALEDFDGPGTGVIRVMVTPR